jgi:ATP-dependent DNA ligase
LASASKPKAAHVLQDGAGFVTQKPSVQINRTPEGALSRLKFNKLCGLFPSSRSLLFMWAFDVIELDTEDMRREPLEMRRATLEALLRRPSASGIRFNEHIQEDGPIVFKHACRLGLEGIVSKRKDSPYLSGRSPH